MSLIESRKKTGISFLIAMSISVFLFFVIMASLPDSLYTMYQSFFSQDLPDDKKIFILGSSHVFAINPTIISEYLEKFGHSYTVYNLGGPGDDFEERLRTLDMIIEKKPEIVVYGIEPRAFESAGRTGIDLPDNPLPSIGSITEIFSNVEIPNKEGILKNPKFALIRSISNPTQDIESHTKSHPNSPFITYGPKDEQIVDIEELKNIKNEYVAKINPINKNANLISLKNIIEKLNQNDIKVIIFVTPHSKLYLENYPEDLEKIFNTILDEVSEKEQTDIYSLYKKYSERNVWKDHTHLAINEQTTFYSEDVAGFILSELEK